MEARYADGRAATTAAASCELGAEALTFQVGGDQHVWGYADLARADDNNGRIILKFKRDAGERLTLDLDAKMALRAAAPKLFHPSARGIEGLPTLGAVAASAWSLAAAFLLGVPMAAAPLADIVPPRYRARIADISWSQVEQFAFVCDDADEGERILNDLAYRLMAAGEVPERDEIWVSIVSAGIPNAFALPDNNIIVTDQLIAMADHPDEIAGVIAHEIAHIEHNHVMKNIIRNIGAGIFFDIVFGGAGAGQAVAIATVNLASLRYSRGDEADADSRGLEYLAAANIDAGGLARLFERLDEMEKEFGLGEIPLLLSSHPASDARAAAARARGHAGLQPSLSDRDWRLVRSACGGTAEPNGPPPAPPNAPQNGPPGAPVPSSTEPPGFHPRAAQARSPASPAAAVAQW